MRSTALNLEHLALISFQGLSDAEAFRKDLLLSTLCVCLLLQDLVCVLITAGPIIKLCAGGEYLESYHVQRRSPNAEARAVLSVTHRGRTLPSALPHLRLLTGLGS